jgi:hypothetical protein
MAPIPSTLMSSRSKKKEPRYVYMIEAKVSHSHKIWTEVSSFLPYQLWGPTLSHIQWILEFFAPVVKLLGFKVDHSPPPSAEIKNECSYTSTPHIHHQTVGRDNFLPVPFIIKLLLVYPIFQEPTQL